MRYFSTAAEEKKLIRTGAGRLLSLQLANAAVAARYAYVFDGTDATGIVIGIFDVPTLTTRALDFSLAPISFSTGLYVASSTSISAYAASTAADFRYGVSYADR